MKVAVTYENGNIFQHFGRTSQFKLYDVEGDQILSEKIMDTNGTGHGALAGLLGDADVEVLICGGIGMGAQAALQNVGIRLYPGVSGEADQAVKALIGGTLQYDPDAHCDHHGHGGAHTCGNHGCGSHS